ncbi:hypothetical protein BB558_002796 [Smittium angustum]|uniref:alpha-amylase n=1 Tax=Smittium angustum TaxID=133377 RepID=A0A2U1J7W0_SMIAN|nr:hypothetical protein BB558_002796 [Smittium angustum]
MRLLSNLFLLASIASASSTDQWKSRSIYQLLTDRFAQSPNNIDPSKCTSPLAPEYDIRHYCGGTYNGLISRLDYIQDMGFDAIWISPITAPVEYETVWGVGWHGYWQQDIYGVNPHFGTRQDIKDLVSECHKRDIYVMVDIVANHMGPYNNTVKDLAIFPTGYDWYYPFNKTEDYHNFCLINDYTNATEVQQCCLGGADSWLPDLNTENPEVVDALNNWIHGLVEEFNFDSVRIDTFRHIRPSFWPEFVKQAGVFAIGEVADTDAINTGPWQDVADSVLNFPLWDALGKVFRDKDRAPMYNLTQQIDTNREHFRDTLVLGNFLDNHDQPRFLNYTTDPTRINNALTFLMTADGIPILYYGTEQGFNGHPEKQYGAGDPWNRDPLWGGSGYDKTSSVYQFVSKLNKLRKMLKSNYPSFFDTLMQNIQTDNSTLTFFKNPLTISISNAPFENSKSVTVPKGSYSGKEGYILVNYLNGDHVGKVQSDGSATITIKDNNPVVAYPKHICPV